MLPWARCWAACAAAGRHESRSLAHSTGADAPTSSSWKRAAGRSSSRPSGATTRARRPTLSPRLGRTIDGRPIETAIALVYPPELHSLAGAALRTAINSTRGLEYALYTRRINEPPERLPETGWIRGGVRDLAMLVNRAAVPAPRVEALATEIERGVDLAANEFSRRHGRGSELGDNVAKVLGQADDKDGQTRRMAMTVIANALVFHESLAATGFQVAETLAGDESGAIRNVRRVDLLSARRPLQPRQPGPGMGAHPQRELLADLLVRQGDTRADGGSHSERRARPALADGPAAGRGRRDALARPHGHRLPEAHR